MPPSPSRVSLLPPEVTDDAVSWHLPKVLAPGGVRLEVDWGLDQAADFVADGDWWTYLLERPAADRLEYRLELRGGDGLVPDPTNPHVVPNPFGDRSEIRFPSYAPPAWLATSATGDARPIVLDAGPLEGPIPVRLWSPEGMPPDAAAPLLITHDGSGMAQSGSLLSWATAHAEQQPIRVALLDTVPGCRDGWYSANPDYLDQLSGSLLPALRDRVNVSAVVGLGASLGAVAMLSWHRRDPAAVDGLALQSGSFFRPELDPQESAYPHFDRIYQAVTDAIDDPPDRRVPTLVTCGAIEENYANNQRMAEQLAGLDYPVRFITVPDAHTMIGWRDAWTPHLDELLQTVV